MQQKINSFEIEIRLIALTFTLKVQSQNSQPIFKKNPVNANVNAFKIKKLRQIVKFLEKIAKIFKMSSQKGTLATIDFDQ